MIRFCTCTGRSSSSLQNPDHLDGSKICKSCGGKLTVDRKGALSGNMLNTMGLELPRPIDPEVKWKTASRGRQRAGRRARTSFNGEDRMMFVSRSLNSGENAAEQESSKAREIPVSESEKLGVSILGRRFSDPIESVPIKKRRFLMARSPSPPPSSLQSDQSQQILSSSCGDSSSHGKHRKGRTLVGEDICSKDAKEGPSDAADFSGISILAAAACESGMEGDILNGECSMHDVQSLKERKLADIMRSTQSSSLPEMEKSKTLDDSHCGSDSRMEASACAPDSKSSVITVFNSLGSPVESSAPDAKSFVDTTLNSSDNPDKSLGCSMAAVNNRRKVDTSRDSRLHWDLNVAMEVWDSNCDDDVVGSEPGAAAFSKSNSNEDEAKELGTCHRPVVCTDTRDIPDLSADKIHAVDLLKEAEMKEESDIPVDISALPSCSVFTQNVQQLESASLNMKDGSAETKDLPNQKNTSCASEVDSHVGSNLVRCSLAAVTEYATLSPGLEKVEVSHPMLDRECLSHLIAIDGFGGGNSVQACELGSRVDRLVNKPVSEESTNLATISAFNKSFADHGLNYAQIGEAALQSVSEFDKQELLDVDSGSGKVEDVSDRLHVVKEVRDANADGNRSDPHPENSQKSADLDKVVSMNAKGATNDILIDDKNCSMKDDPNTSNAKADCIGNAAYQATGPNSEGTNVPIAETDDIVGSQAVAISYPSGYENKLGKVVSNDCLDRCYDSDASHIGTDQVAGIGKIDLEDDDSQYEDGELRESGNYSWADDGYEEVDHVDYEGSDYKDNEVAGDIPSASLPIDSSSHKILGFSVEGNDGIQSRKKDSDAAVLPASTNCLSSTVYVEKAFGKRCAESAGEKIWGAPLKVKEDTRPYEVDANLLAGGSTATESRIQREGDGLGEHQSNTRIKSTGWDRLPENARTSHNGSRDVVDSAIRGVASTSLDASRGSDSLRQVRLSSNRDVQSRIERPRSFDGANRNDPCRPDDGYRSGSKSERTIGTHRSLGRGGASRHSQVGGRGEQWVETPNRSGPTRPRSPDYYGYGPPGRLNAAAAAVAKMESNGFVVAPDGTLVKAAGAATAGRVPRRSGNSLHSSNRPLSGRGSPIDRDGGMSRGPPRTREVSPDRHFGVSQKRSGRYGPEMERDRFHRVVTDGSMNSAHHSISRRRRSFSPHRASLHLSRSHTRSPSRSKSRSPRLWTSPRGRRDMGANGVSSLRRHSRSPPNYRTEVRTQKMTSPHRRPAFEDRIVSYSPSSGNHTYSPHASRWVDERKCSPVDLRDHNYKRYPARSPPPLRITSRSHRFDLMDSPVRSRPEEFYRPMHSSRIPAYGFERGNRHVGNGDGQREYADGYGSLHSVRPYDRNASTRRFRNDAGDAFRSHNSAPKSPEFQRRRSPRNFDRGFERQLPDSSHGAKEEKDPRKYARDGKDDAAYKPYEIQDRDDIAVRRRPS